MKTATQASAELAHVADLIEGIAVVIGDHASHSGLSARAQSAGRAQ